MDLHKRIQALLRKAATLYEDDAEPLKLNPPASKDQISGLEAKLGVPLPPSYKAFLELHNGARDFFCFDRLFGTEDHGSTWYNEQRDWLLGVDWEETAFNTSHIFVMAESGSGIHNFRGFDPEVRDVEDELEVIDWDYGHELGREPSFLAWLEKAVNMRSNE